MKKNNNESLIKKNILKESKKYIPTHGWNDNLFTLISSNNKYKISTLNSLFPSGYISLLKFYLEEMNKSFLLKAKKLNLGNMRTHIKVRELILLKINLYELEKQIIKKTYFTLLLPKYFNISSYALYKTVDEIWFIAGDHSTDFNYYSKRAILAAIYSSVIFHWISNNDIKSTTNFLDLQLKRVSKIPKVKSKIKDISTQLPQGFKNLKKIFAIMQ